MEWISSIAAKSRLRRQTKGAIAALVARQIEADERGELLDHVVDRRLGY